jgi:hypothetical protein
MIEDLHRRLHFDRDYAPEDIVHLDAVWNLDEQTLTPCLLELRSGVFTGLRHGRTRHVEAGHPAFAVSMIPLG